MIMRPVHALDDDRRRAGRGVLEGVGQGLLDDAVGRNVQVAWQPQRRDRPTVDVDTGVVEAVRPGPAAAPARAPGWSAGARGGRRPSIGAQVAEHAVQLRQGLPAGVLHPLQQLAGLAGSRSSISRAAPAWTTSRLTVWPTRSCSSRDIRTRSSATTCRSSARRARSWSSRRRAVL